MRPQLVLLFLIFVFGLIKAADLSEESAFLVLANSQQNDKLHQLYQKIPASLMTHLEVEQIVRPIQFRSNFDVNGVGVGVESHLVLLNFEIHLRESIETEFKSMRFEEIRAEDLSGDITKHYRNKVLERPQQGETAKAIIKFEKVYKGRAGEKRIAAVTANVYMEITERFEKNWLQQINEDLIIV